MDIEEPEISARASRFAERLLERPLRNALVLVVFIIAGGAIVPSIGVDGSFEQYYNLEARSYLLKQELSERFVSDEVVFVAYETKDVFSRASLDTIRKVATRIERIEVEGPEGAVIPVEDVLSIPTVKDAYGSDLSFRSAPLVADPTPEDPAALEAIRARAKKNRIIREALLGNDDSVAGMLIRLRADLPPDLKADAVIATRAILSEVGAAEDTRFHVTGDPVYETDLVRYIVEDVIRLVPLTYAIVLFFLFFFLRRIRAMVVGLTNVTIVLIVAMAMIPLTGAVFNTVTAAIPSITLVIGVSITLHVFSHLGKNALTHPNDDPPRRTLAQLMWPIAICQVTTAFGFFSLAATDITPVRHFGMATGWGILAALPITFLVLSIAFRKLRTDALVSPNALVVSPKFERGIAVMADVTIRHARLIFLVSLVVCGALVWSASLVVSGENMLENFDESKPVRQATEYVEDHLGGSTVLTVSIKHKEQDHFLEPANLQKLKALDGFLRKEIAADQVISPVDFIEIMHRAFFIEDDKELRIPDTREQVAQLLLLNTDERLSETLDSERRWARVLVRIDDHGTPAILAKYKRVDEFLGQTFPESAGYELVHAGGGARVFAEQASRYISSLAISLGITAFLVLVVLAAFFRSLKAVVLVALPNAFPIFLGVGVMGLLDIQLNIATINISAIALGIAVDDTVHFMECYMRARRSGADAPSAVRTTFALKAPGLIGTSVINALGFGVMAVSNFPPVQHFGLLTGTVMIGALVGDLFILAAVLVLFDRGRIGPAPRDSQEPA